MTPKAKADELLTKYINQWFVFGDYLSIAKAEDKGSPNLSFAPQPSKVLIGYANIPDTGYGS